MNEEPEWPVAGAPPPDQSPYQSVLSSANPDSYGEAPPANDQPTGPDSPRKKIDRSKVVGAGPKHRASGRLSKSAPISSVYAAAQATSARAHPPPPPEPTAPPQVFGSQALPPQPPPQATPGPAIAPQPLAPQAFGTPASPPPAFGTPAARPGRPVPPPPPPPTVQQMPYPQQQPPYLVHPAAFAVQPAGPPPVSRGGWPVPQPVRPVFVTSAPPAMSAPPAEPLPAGQAGTGTGGAKRIITLVIVLVLVIGLSLGGYFIAWPMWTQSHATVIAPNNLIGLDKIGDSNSYRYPRSVATDLRDAGLSGTFTAGYLAGDDPSHVMLLFAGTGFALFPEDRIGGLFDKIMRDRELQLTAIKGVSAGPLGGTAKCAKGTYQSQPVAICGWADYGTTAIVIFYNRTPAEGEVLMRAVRPGVLHRT